MQYTVEVKKGNAWEIVATTNDKNFAYHVANMWGMRGFVAVVS